MVKLDGQRDSNPRPLAWKADALPIELCPQNRIPKPRREIKLGLEALQNPETLKTWATAKRCSARHQSNSLPANLRGIAKKSVRL